MENRIVPRDVEGGRSGNPWLGHRLRIVLAVAGASYFVGRMGASLPTLALFGAAVALALYAHLSGRGDNRFAAVYAGLMGTGAALVAGLLDWLA